MLTCTVAADGYASMVKGQFAGNPQYLAPEVISALGQQMVDEQPFRFKAAAAESWSAGVVLYFAATHSCTRAGAGAGAVPHPVRAPPHRLFAGCG